MNQAIPIFRNTENSYGFSFRLPNGAERTIFCPEALEEFFTFPQDLTKATVILSDKPCTNSYCIRRLDMLHHNIHGWEIHYEATWHHKVLYGIFAELLEETGLKIIHVSLEY